MRLLELNPRWVAISRWDTPDGTQHFYDTPPRRGGISFDCPIHTKYCECCKQPLPQSHRLVVFFSNPVDGLPPQVTEHLWTRSGEEFDNLTLAPSIDASKYEINGTTCWHGYITDGAVN